MMTVDMKAFEQIRALMGPRLITTIGYFKEDGEKAVAAMEHAQRSGDASAMIMPAHTLKTEARQLGAIALGDHCYDIELGARHCVEIQEGPEDLMVAVAKLRALFRETMTIFDRETNPLHAQTPKRRGFGRAVV
ncbi:MAG: Hpt domain-containing protein [Pacificimonas sp.]